MTISCDTSLLVTALASERATAAVQAWLGDHLAVVTISLWVDTGIASALAQQRRMGLLHDDEAARLQRTWRGLRAAMPLLPIAPRRFERAAALVARSRLGLRASDALHVAIAADAGATLATLDRKLLRACGELDVAAIDPLVD